MRRLRYSGLKFKIDYMRIVFIILFCVSFLNVKTKNINTKRKNLIIRSKVVNFGDVKQDTLLTARFYLINNMDSVIDIHYVNPDCMCTKFSVSNYKIDPRDSVYVDLSLNTKNKYGKQKIYTIIKAETYTKMYKLTLKANVITTNAKN